MEAAGAPTLTGPWRPAGPVTLDRVATMADGIAVATCSELTFAHARAFVDDIVLVDEEEISQAMLLLDRTGQSRGRTGGGGVAGRHPGRPESRGTGPAVAILSGGNVDPLLLTKLIEHGLSAAGRYLTLRVVMADRVGAPWPPSPAALAGLASTSSTWSTTAAVGTWPWPRWRCRSPWKPVTWPTTPRW